MEGLRLLSELGFLPTSSLVYRPLSPAAGCKKSSECSKKAEQLEQAELEAVMALRRCGGRIEAVIEHLLSTGSFDQAAHDKCSQSGTTNRVSQKQSYNLGTQNESRKAAAAPTVSSAAGRKLPAGQTDLRSVFGPAAKAARLL